MRPQPGHRLQPGSLQAEIPAAVWVGADAIKVLAGPALAQLVYQPPPEESLPKHPLLQAADRVLQSTDDKQEKPPKDEPVRAHEFRAAVLLRQGKPVSTLAELEAALCLAEKKSLLAPEEIWQRWHSLSASAVAWSLDTLATADPARRAAGAAGDVALAGAADAVRCGDPDPS